jgi:UDP-perosamine 4-acetyltransferase
MTSLMMACMQHKPLMIVGGGGHTRVLLAMAQAAGATVRGIITSDAALVGTTIFNVTVLDLEERAKLDATQVALLNGVGNHASHEGPGLAPRMALYARYRAKGFAFPALLSTAAIVQAHVTIGHGVQIMPGAVVQPGAMLGENCIINTHASIDHDVVIGAHCHVAPGAVLCGHVQIGEASHIGAGAIITERVKIGSNVLISAGAVVTRDVADGTLLRREET